MAARRRGWPVLGGVDDVGRWGAPPITTTPASELVHGRGGGHDGGVDGIVCRDDVHDRGGRHDGVVDGARRDRPRDRGQPHPAAGRCRRVQDRRPGRRRDAALRRSRRGRGRRLRRRGRLRRGLRRAQGRHDGPGLSRHRVPTGVALQADHGHRARRAGVGRDHRVGRARPPVCAGPHLQRSVGHRPRHVRRPLLAPQRAAG